MGKFGFQSEGDGQPLEGFTQGRDLPDKVMQAAVRRGPRASGVTSGRQAGRTVDVGLSTF